MLGNLVLENCNNPGTGAITPAGAPAGRLTFVGAFGSGTTVYYVLTDGTQTEEGWTVTGTSMTRNVTWTSSAGASSSPLNFTGACQVYNFPPGDRILWADQNQIWQARNRRLAGLSAGSDVADASRIDQVGNVRIGSYTPDSGTGTIVVPLPAAGARWDIEMSAVGASGNGEMFMRVSVDGGASFSAPANGYSFNVNGTAGQNTYGKLTSMYLGSGGARGKLELDTPARQWRSWLSGYVAGPAISNDFSAGDYPAGTVTHVQIGMFGQSLNSGVARLLRKDF